MSLLAALLVWEPLAQATSPWVGVALDPTPGGAKVTRVLPTSPAEKAGLKQGDIIKSVNGATVDSPALFLQLTDKTRVGQTLQVAVLRSGRLQKLQLRVAARPELSALLRLFLLGTLAPDFVLPLVNEARNMTLSSLRGKVVILYFWASWCDSCKLNMPRLIGLYKTYRKRGLDIFSMGQDKQVDTLRKTTQELGLPFPVGHNVKNRVGLLYKSKNLPTLIVVDRQGVIREYLQGSSFSFSSLEATLRKLL
jgi:peroxiredoxin